MLETILTTILATKKVTLFERQVEPEVIEIFVEEKKDIKGIVDVVYRLESSGGKNDSCRKIGKFNGYGYAQNKHNWKCYNTQEEVRNIVEDWFEEVLKTRSLPEAVCGYNLGFNQEDFDCEYYKKFKKTYERI